MVTTPRSKNVWSKDFEGTWYLIAIPGMSIAVTIVAALIISAVKSCKRQIQSAISNNLESCAYDGCKLPTKKMFEKFSHPYT